MREAAAKKERELATELAQGYELLAQEREAAAKRERELATELNLVREMLAIERELLALEREAATRVLKSLALEREAHKAALNKSATPASGASGAPHVDRVPCNMQ